MTRTVRGILVPATLVLLAATASARSSDPLEACGPDAVVSDAVCMDTYEASVWRVPDPTGTNRTLVRRIWRGEATRADLTAGGAMQLGVASDDYAPCADSGQNCTDDIYAVSLPGETPSTYLTWFQAQAACENSRKRLPSSAEWQSAVAGTPDPGPDNGARDCNTNSALGAVATGSRRDCRSSHGAYDMVGNLWEWVADWVPPSTKCGSWSPEVTEKSDYQCLAGAEMTGEPGALLRGGGHGYGAAAGPFTILIIRPSFSGRISRFGFRCAR